MGGEPWPQLGQQAVRNGRLSARQLLMDYHAIYRNVYHHKALPVTALTRARAAWLWSAGKATLVGMSAAVVLGAKWIDPQLPAELSRADRHCPRGIRVHTYDLALDECCVIDGMRLTTAARTAFDLGRTLEQDNVVPHLDALFRATQLKVADVESLAARYPRARGVRQLKSTLALVDGGSESPQESRVRLLLVRAGLPPPETQIEFLDKFGMVRVRVDMGWREWKVAVEYDGVQHWQDRRQRSWDIDRVAMLEASGWIVVRVSAEMLTRPNVIVERVSRAIRANGFR